MAASGSGMDGACSIGTQSKSPFPLPSSPSMVPTVLQLPAPTSTLIVALLARTSAPDSQSEFTWMSPFA